MAGQKSFDSLIEYICKQVANISGNILGHRQYSMVQGRIRNRLLELKMTLPEYKKHLELRYTEEINHLVGLLTTHHTYFFREYSQYLVLKDLLKKNLKNGHELKIWSAACSRGHEVYSLAMFLEYHAHEFSDNFSYSILGTDIDQNSIDVAENGVYRKNDLSKVPLKYLGNHWLRGKNQIEDFLKVSPDIKSKCKFQIHNLLDASNNFGVFDLILVRNVLIYFNEATTNHVMWHLNQNLKADGIIACGATERISSPDLGFMSIGPSVYSRQKATTSTSQTRIEPKTKKLKILCVDDSPSILKILDKIIGEEDGFEVIGTATNGIEASKKVSELNPDLVTLDIHMPEQDGLEYLKKNYSKNHPPVLMVSSARRSDSDLVQKCLKLGASDYIEKPSLQNMKVVGEEIINKLRSLTSSRNTISSFDSLLASKKPVPSAKKAILLGIGKDRLNQAGKLLDDLSDLNLPIFVFIKDSAVTAKNLASTISCGWNIITNKDNPEPDCNNLIVCESESEALSQLRSDSYYFVNLGIGKENGIPLFKNLNEYEKRSLILEDSKESLSLDPKYCVPITSFKYHVKDILFNSGDAA